MWPNLKKTAELVTFTEEILNGKLYFCVVAIKTFTYEFGQSDMYSKALF